jgi:mediator of RNA polymerase II transcription subunit 12
MMDLVLRIITSSTGAPESIDLGNGATGARHRLLDVIAVALQSVERQLSDEEVHVLGDLEPLQPGSLLRVVLKLLKFTLGLGRSEANMLTTPRADFGKLAMSFLRVLAVCLSLTSVLILGTSYWYTSVGFTGSSSLHR